MKRGNERTKPLRQMEATAIHRAAVRKRTAGKPVTEQQQKCELRMLERERKRSEAIANAERDGSIRTRFHAWMQQSGFRPMPIPALGCSYPGSHLETLWEAYLDATLQERAAK